MNRLFHFFLPALCAAAAPCVQAQVDLAAQRAEDRTVRAVGGKARQSQIVINPTPQQLTLTGGKAAASVPVRSRVAPESSAVKPVSGAYVMSITPDAVDIEAFDDRGLFYAGQTLRQIRESAGSDSLPLLTVSDFPSLPMRGVVEGFYGTPWSHAVRLSLIDFYGRNKMNTYIYGPKDDPYHSSPDWRLPYPEEQARNIRELVDACARNHVDFVWAIHPGKDIKWNEEDYANLVRKFEMMYALGVRSFAIFFDDIEGEGTNPNRQVALLNRLTDDFVRTHEGVVPLTVCPTDYSRLWANSTENGASAIYGRTLYPEINVMYTGDVVCSDLTKDTMDFFNALVKRPGYYWWNWPVTDYARNYILQGPAYGLDTTLTSADVAALVSNPMEYGEASKLALYGVADYAWNIPAFNSLDNWERGLRELMPECPEAYRAFAIHSCDTETGYRRDESWETEPFRFTDPWTPEQLKAMRDVFTEATLAPDVIRRECTDSLLLQELDPWLTEFEKLGKRGLKVCYLMENFNTLSPEKFMEIYRSAEMTDNDREAYKAHKSGSMKLQHFYEHAMEDLLNAFRQKP